MKTKNNLTEGPIVKSLINLTIPIVFTNILHTAYSLVDTFWVGRLGKEAMASVSLSFPVIFLLISLGGGLAIAGTILVAQYRGKGESANVNYISAQTFLMMFFASLIVTAAGYFSAEFFIKLMNAETSVSADAIAYLKISFLGMIFLFAYFVFQALMRGNGDVKTPMYIVLGTVILNLILDPLFIFGYGPVPAYGVRGAAITTIATQALAAIIGLVFLFDGRYGIHLKLRDFQPDFKLLGKMFRLGFPASVEQSMRAGALMAMVFLVAEFGTVTVAAYGIGTRILSLVFIPALGLAMSTSTLVGQNIGAGKPERAVKISRISAMVGFISLSVMGIIIFAFAENLSAFFLPGEVSAIRSSAMFIKIMALSFGFIAIEHVLNGAFRGAGNTFISLLFTIISVWLLRLPLAYFLSRNNTLAQTGIWLAFPLANIAGALIAMVYFSKGKWKDKKVTDEIQLEEQVSEEAILETQWG